LKDALKEANRMDLMPYGNAESFFSIIAVNRDKDKCLEVWYINEKKEIRNLINDEDAPCGPYSQWWWHRYKNGRMK